ncbi:uncharacterized protein LOC124256630 isoform X2 [Haliotis rubra]|uniref:uncharacterized protein LOC124256630 isoform X2 n=1 Tax=Haliotis rubra TaxID=36100 RepID=UPI001EE53513|nr:uncharacterized protein LOC124256630 isoform X2 [Haliotis rubra]
MGGCVMRYVVLAVLMGYCVDVVNSQGPKCEPQVNVSMSSTQQQSGDPVYCVNSTIPTCNDTNDLNYTITNNYNIFEFNGACLMLLKTDFTQRRYCITVFATQILSTPQHDNFDLCVTFNEAPVFGSNLNPAIIIIPLLNQFRTIDIPLNTTPDAISQIQLSDVSPSTMASDFSITSDTPVINYTKPTNLTLLANVTSVDLTVNVTDDGNPPLSAQKVFTLLLVNDAVTCDDTPTILNVDTTVTPPAVKPLSCRSEAGNSISYKATVLSGANFDMSVFSNGSISMNTTSQVADFNVTVEASSMYDVRTSFNFTISAGKKPNCTVSSSVLNVKAKDTVDSIYINFTCETAGSNKDAMEFDIDNDIENDFFAVSATSREVRGMAVGNAGISLAAVYNESTFPSSVTVTVTNVYGETKLMFNVVIVNTPPVFVPSTIPVVTVSEKLASGGQVYNITATDEESSVTFSIQDAVNSSIPVPFRIVPGTGQISTSGTLNATLDMSYTVKITVRDVGGLNSSINMTINVDDVNEAPQCAYSGGVTLNVDVTAPVNDSVIILNCYDWDVPGNNSILTFSLEGVNAPFAGYFGFNDSMKREILIQQSLSALNLTATPSTTFNVIVADEGTPSLNLTLPITLNFSDKRPTCSNTNLQDSISERSAVASCLNVTHSCSNPTATGLTFNLTSTSLGSGDKSLLQYFTLGTNSVGSQLPYLTVCLEKNITGLPGIYKSGLQVSNNLFSTTLNLTFEVLDVNDLPVISGLSINNTYTINETSPVTTPLATLNITDPDPGNNGALSVSFEAVSPSSAHGGDFEFDNVTKMIKVAQVLNATRNTDYNYTITATDGGGLSTSVNVIILVDDVNEAPKCELPGDFTVNATASPNFVIGQLVCWDTDVKAEYRRLMYDVQPTEMGATSLINVSSEGIIKLLDTIPYQHDRLSYQVTVSNGSPGNTIGPSVTIPVVIVYNKAFPPTCNVTSVSVQFKDTDSVGCAAEKVKCTNPLDKLLTVQMTNLPDNFRLEKEESGRSIAFRMCSNNSNFKNSVGSHDVKVLVENGLGNVTVTWNVVVEDVNEAPQFQNDKYHGAIPETTSFGTTIAVLQISSGSFNETGLKTADGLDIIRVTDPDKHTPRHQIQRTAATGKIVFKSNQTAIAADNLPIEFSSSSMSVSYFSVRGDLDESVKYQFTIEAVDGGNESVSAMYTVDIIDINEAPACTVSNLTFNMNLVTEVGTRMETLSCTDPDYDINNTVTVYTMEGTDQEFFNISSSGVITLGRRLPRDRDTLQLQAVASDGANSSLKHVVDISVNVNRSVSARCELRQVNPPVWIINSVISLNVICTDPTADATSTLTYTESGNYTSGFTRDGDSGSYNLSYTQSTNGTYYIEITVDNGLKNVSLRADIGVVYLRSTPTFEQLKYEVNVTENIAVGDTFLTVQAVTGGNFSGNITYQITAYEPASVSSYFQVKPETGELQALKTLKELLMQRRFEVELTVQATDTLSLLESTVSITVIIQEINIPPNCEAIPDTVKVSLSKPVGALVLKVNCTDANFRPSLNQVSYTLKVPDDYFALGDEGKITLKQPLSLTTRTYALRIGITDGHSNQQVTVVISVQLTQNFTIKLVKTTTTSIQMQWRFVRADYISIVNRFIVEYQGGDKVYPPKVEVEKKNGTDLTGLQPGTIHVISVKAETIFGNATSNTLTDSTRDVPVLTKMTVRYKDKNTEWKADFNNLTSNASKMYISTAETNLKMGLKAVTGLHEVKVIGLSSGSVLVDAIVAVNQTGNINNAERDFRNAVNTGQLGTQSVDAGFVDVKNGDKYAVITSMKLGSGDDTVSEDANVSVECVFRLVGDNPPPTVKWRLNDKAISATSSGKYTPSITPLDTDVFGHVARLSIISVGSQDNGTYKCELKSGNLSEHRSLSVLVLQKPAVKLEPLTNFVKSQTAVELNCTMVSGEVQNVVFRWYRDNNLISNPPVVKVSPTKEILKIDRALSDSTFSCRVMNRAGTTTSHTATIKVVRSSVKTCNQSHDSQGTLWMSSPVGETITMNCPHGYQGLVQRVCSSAGQWQRADYTGCRLETLVALQDQLNTIETGFEITDADSVVSQLKDVTENNQLVAGDVDASINIINQVVSIAQTQTAVKKELVKDVVESASNMLNTANKTVWEDLHNENKQGVTSLLKTLDSVGQLASEKTNPSSNDQSLTIITANNIVLAYGKTNPKDITFPQASNVQYPAWVQTSKTKVTIKAQAYEASVPGQPEVVTNNLMGYSGVLYKDIEELVNRRTSADGTSQDPDSVSFEKKINSRILSFSLIPTVTTKMNPSVTLSFEHLNGNFSEPVCGFLNYSAPYEQDGQWSSEGCRVVNNTENMTVCDCDHLTNFAILMSPGRISEQDAKVLSIISAVGCGISIFFLVLTICIYCFLWRYVKSDRAIILINLCFALIIAYSIFLGGVTQTENQAVCTAISALLHFFFLVVFFLMLAEGVEVLVSVIYVFNTKSRLRWLLLLSWGAPVVVVGISLGVTQLKGYGSEQFCWLSLESGLLWAFVAPALAVILANLIIVFIVLKTMFSTTAMMTKSAIEKGRAGLKALCVLLPLMGVTWVFGVFSVNEDLTVFQYLFAVFNSLQGFFIFIFHCLVSRQVQDGMKNRKRRYRAKSFKTTGTESSSQMPASKLVSTSSDEDRPINDLDKKGRSPFIEADRQVQQIANKLYANPDNLMDNNNPQKPSNKVNVPVDPSDIKLGNTLDSFLFPPSDIHKPAVSGQPPKQDQNLSRKDDIIEENESFFTEMPSPLSTTAVPPSPMKKNAWGEQSSPLHFSDYKLPAERQQTKMPPEKTKARPHGLMDHYDSPPAYILADPRIQDRDPDSEINFQERKKRVEQVYSGEAPRPGQQNKGRKPVSGKSSGQSSNNSQRSGDDRQPVDQDVETIHLYESRELPLYRGRVDDNWGKVKTAVERKKRQQRNSSELQRNFVHSEEDLSRYGSRQPFGGIRTTDVGVPVMSRPRQHREVSRHDPNRHYRYM